MRFAVTSAMVVFATVCLAFQPDAFAGAAGPVKGLVLDGDTLEPVVGAQVRIEKTMGGNPIGEFDEGVTKEEGSYKITAPIVKVRTSIQFSALHALIGVSLIFLRGG